MTICNLKGNRYFFNFIVAVDIFGVKVIGIIIILCNYSISNHVSGSSTLKTWANLIRVFSTQYTVVTFIQVCTKQATNSEVFYFVCFRSPCPSAMNADFNLLCSGHSYRMRENLWTTGIAIRIQTNQFLVVIVT